MMKQQPHKTVKNHERKVIQGIGRKFLASSLCALLSVSNGLNWPVLATEAETDPEVVEQQPMEDETEIVSEEENPTAGNEQGLCVHHPWHDAQCGTDPCQYRCVPCLQEDIAEIIAILTEESAEEDPLQAVYTRIEYAYDTYVALNEDELAQLEEDEYAFMEAVLRQEESIIQSLDALDQQVDENGQAEAQTLTQLYQEVAAAYGAFMEEKAGQETKPDEEQDPVEEGEQPKKVITMDDDNKDTSQKENEQKSGIAEGDEAPNSTTPDATEKKMKITAVSIKDDSGVQHLIGTSNSTENQESEGDQTQPIIKKEFSINYAKQIALHLEVESQLNLKDKKVEITIPDGLVVVEYPKPDSTTGMVKSVTPERAEDLKGTGDYGAYQPQSGTITYALKDTAEKTSFNIILALDTTLWNKTTPTNTDAFTTLSDAIMIRTYSGKEEDGINYDSFSATAKVSGDVLATGPVLSKTKPKNTNLATESTDPFKLTDFRYRPDRSMMTLGTFFKEFSLTIPLPKNTKKNDYASLVYIESDRGYFSYNDPKHPENKPDVEEKEDHVTLTWKNIYIPEDEYFIPYFVWKQGETLAPDESVQWDLKSIKSDLKDWKNNNSSLASFELSPLTFTGSNTSDVSVNSVGRGKSLSLYGMTDVLCYLGKIDIDGAGTKKTGPMKLEYTYDNTNGFIGVVAQKIPAPVGAKVTNIQYKTNKKEQFQTLEDQTSTEGFVALTIADLGLSDDEYFTAITAVVDGYDPDFTSDITPRLTNPAGAKSAIFGRVLKNDLTEENKKINIATLKVTPIVDGEEKAESLKTKTLELSICGTTENDQIPLGLTNAVNPNNPEEKLPILDKVLCTAGDEVHFNGVMMVSSHPYTTHNVLNDLEVYIRFPKSVSVQDLVFYKQTGSTADSILLEQNAVENGIITRGEEITPLKMEELPEESEYVTKKFTFDKDVIVGWFGKDFSQYQVGISFTMKIDKGADAMTLDMRECVKFKTEKWQAVSDKGSVSNSTIQVGETYYGTLNVNAQNTKLSVTAARQGLTFDFGAKLCDDTNCSGKDYKNNYVNYDKDNEKVFLKDKDHGVDLRMIIKNETKKIFLGEAKDFYYYIPVPKKGDNWDTHMQEMDFDFDMIMTGPVKVEGSFGHNIHVQYSTTVESKVGLENPYHYNNTDHLKDNYKDADEIDDWSKVKMIRISTNDGIVDISADAEVEIYAHFETAKDASDLVGSKINFGPCGYSPYTVGTADNGGHMPLPHIQIEFQTGIIAGKVFVDENKNGQMDDGEPLYTGKLTIKAPHGTEIASDDHESHEVTVENGEFKFEGRREDTYFLEVINPGSPDANGKNPLKFSIPETSKFQEVEEGKSAKATIIVNAKNSAENQSLILGLQTPHTIHFEIPDSNATIQSNTMYVWNKETLGKSVPLVAPKSGWKFMDLWTLKGEDEKVTQQYTTEELSKLPVTKNMTFVPQLKKIYTVTYDGNGHTSGELSTENEFYTENDLVALRNFSELKTSNSNVICVGWSTEKITDVLTADAEQSLINKVIKEHEYTMPTRNVVFYAVWAEDLNGNGSPDYSDNAVHVRYHSNTEKEMVVQCLHHHLQGKEAILSSTAASINGKKRITANPEQWEGQSGTYSFEKEQAVFLGWSESASPKDVDTMNDYNAIFGEGKKPLTKVIMDINGKDVYAVWGTDRNKNGVADYQERVRVIYDGNSTNLVSNLPENEQDHIPGDIVALKNSPKPTHSDLDGKKVVFIGWSEKPLSILKREDAVPNAISKITLGSGDATVYAVWGYDSDDEGKADVLDTYALTYDLNGGKPKDGVRLPEKQENIPKGTNVPLSAETQFKRNENEVFIGWSKEKHEDAFTAAQGSAINDMLITGKEIIIGHENVTLYAVWAKDSNANGKPDYKELVKLIYNGNPQSQGTVNKSLLDSVHIPGDTVSLKMSPKPTHSNVDGKRVVFMGWTRNPSTKIYEPKDSVENLNLASQVTFDKDKNHDITVYAAWGYDTDAEGETGYGVADVMERYTLRYDLNGGKGTLPSSRNDLKKNQKVDVASGSFTREALETFIGWSKTRYPAVVSKTPEDLLKPGSSIAVNAHTTLYAVWADDKNGNGTPDGEDEALHVTYHSNTEQEKAENCTHHHVAGETCALSATAQALGFAKENAVWIGWSKTRTDLITSAAGEKKAELVDQFTLQETGNDVYAVWAADKNKNGTPDYEEDGYQILYNANNESGLVVQCGHHHVSGEIVKLYTPKENLFGSEKDIPATAPYTFTMDNAVLMGWSQTPVNSIIQTEEAFAKAPVVENVPVNDSHVQVYAVWAVDKNNNAIPDWKEKNAVYPLNYDPNTSESVENMPEPSQHLAGEKVKLNEKIPTREERNGIQILFAGWSETQSTNVLMAGSKAPEFVAMDLFVMPAKATTLYAIWAEDRNGNGIADYLERSFRLEYDANPIQDKVQNMPKNSEHQVPGELVALQGRPTHEPVESKAVVFLGWTLEPTRNIYEAKDRMPQTIQTIRFGSENVKVYAAWGYDSNEDGTADVLDTYSVTYDLNGGHGTAPQETTHKAGEKFPMRHSADLTKQDAVFAGWSVRKISGVLDENADTKTIESIITADEYEMPAQAVTFYAVWAKDANANGKPDYADNAVHVRYHSNNDENLDVICPHHHVVGANAKLSTTANTIWGSLVSHGEKVAGKIEAHAFKKDNAVFVGWSTRAFPADIKTQKEYDALQAEIFTEMEMKRTGNDVYAVWAVDLDGDKVPDYEKEYLVTYAGNGQSAGHVPPSANYQEGDVFPIAYTSDLQKEGAIFAGWSENQIETILKADTDQALIRSIVTQDTYTMPNRNVTFYAVWAEDKNGDLVPDYAEHAVQVRYHANLGQSEEAVICPHHHIVGTDSELSSAAEHLYGRTETDETIKNHSFQKENAVFIGWSEQPVSQDIQTMAELKTLTLLSKVTMQADGNDVYAVWAADTNQNGVPDYQEQIHLLYDANGGHPNSVPVDMTNYFAGTNVQLANKPVPAHDDIDGVPVRFIGWTKEQAQAIFKRGDEAPTTIDAIRLDRQDVTVFAAWGYDENKDGTADVLETYTLSYDLNEGRGKAPQTQKGMRKGEEIDLPQTGEYTRNANEVFAGWSWTVRPDALTAADKEEAERLIVRKATMPAKNSTLYAVWANDRNGNDIADYLERPLALVFEPNAQAGGTVWRLPAKETGHILGETVSLSQAKPVHDPVKKKAVVFVGWTRKPVETILSRLDTPPETIDKVTFGSQDLRVFAAWGYDEDGDGTADVLNRYALRYDANGGTGQVPAAQDHRQGDTFALAYPADLTKKNAIFAGWSESQITAVLDENADKETLSKIIQDAERTMPAKSLTLYAVWARDANGNGKPDYADDAVPVRYHSNNAQSMDIVCAHHHVAGATVKLSSSAVDLYGRRTAHNGEAKGEVGRYTFTKDKAVFIGWSAKAFPKDIETQAQYDQRKEDIFTEMEMKKKGNDVYAVWALDSNDDGKPDYQDRYALVYDGNGKTSGTLPDVMEYGAGTIVPVAQVENWKKGDAVFAGWSETPVDQILDDDPDPDLYASILMTYEYTMPKHDVTLYAVWAHDTNHDGTPDFAQRAVHVRYHSNNEQNIELECVHHHIVGMQASLSRTARDLYGHAQTKTRSAAGLQHYSFTKDDAVFIGWSLKPVDHAIATSDQYETIEKTLLSEMKMKERDNDVYAVWAQDRNRNGVPDYAETVCVRYHANANTEAVQNMPSDDAFHIPGDTLKLAGNPTHQNVAGKAVVLLGWLREPHAIFTREDQDPTDDLVQEITFGRDDIDVYAAWGYDENGDGKADVLDTYTLAYNANGGTGSVPDPQAGMAKGERVSLPKEADLTRADDEVWIGWSIKPYEAAFSATEGSQAQTALLAADSFTMPSANQTLYAVWAQDQNQNGVADFEEMVHVRYAKNASEGDSVHGMPSASIHLPGDVAALSLKTPTYTANDGRRVLFLGWTREAHAIYTRQDPDPTSALLREIELGKRDVTVYAAWGYDANKDGNADVFETYSLTYDLNGGTGRVPAPQTNVGKGTILALTKEKNFTRHEGETFAGWSRQKLEQAVDDGQNVELEGKELEMGAEDVTLYAVWKRDPNAIIRYTVSYDLNGGQNVASASYAPETMPAGTAYRIQAAPARQGYAFTGWKTNDGKIVQPFDSLTIAGDIQLTAQWRKEGGSAQAGRTPSSRKPSARAARWTDTGQATHRALWMTLLGASGLVAAFLAYRKKQKRK
ncbi:InlB B-repeat-containing protein [uncultured Dubosiella sp.]|uniref:InlB B-repeat-containing protein n=1 Tax=uncultured Dubosiella sp. TaxID=1937011 RepID=UPI0025B3A619|nr:InlB B-repeat-containing protein [uncultured Dubosiella sp.]